MTNPTAWHYTTGHCAIQIVLSGLILPATECVPAREKPVVWFSLNQDWEPTATKGIVDPLTGLRRNATTEEMAHLANGLYRFGVLPSCLMSWTDLKSKTRINRKTALALARVAYEMGGNANHWMGTTTAVSLRHVIDIQKLVNGTWCSNPEQVAGVISEWGSH